MARFLQELGAYDHARALLKLVHPESAEEFFLLGFVRGGLRDEAESIVHLREAVRLAPGQKRYRLELARRHLERGNLKGAIAELSAFDLQRDFSEFDELVVLAELRLAAGDSGAAIGIVRRLERDCLNLDPGDPHLGALHQLLACAYAKLGHTGAAFSAFQKATRIFQRPGVRREWLHRLVRRKVMTGFATEIEARRIAVHDGMSCNVFGDWTAARLKIDLNRNEYLDGKTMHARIPLEVRLLASLRIAEEWGVPGATAKSNLWPDEIYSIQQLEARLKALLHRVRNRLGFRVWVEAGTLFLKAEDFRKIAVSSGGPPLAPTFLETTGARPFRGDAVELFYGISASGRKLLMRAWLSEGWISAEGSGKGQQYRATATALKTAESRR